MSSFDIIVVFLLALLFVLSYYYGSYLYPVTINYMRHFQYLFMSLLTTMYGYESPVNPFPTYQKEGFLIE